MTDSDDTPTILWTALGTGTDAGASCTFANAAAAVTSVTCTDDGAWTLTLTADDGTNPPVADSLLLTIANANPGVGAGADQAAAVGETVSLDPATFSDAGANDTHTAQIDWGDGTAVVAGNVGTGTVSGSHAYGAPGTYTVTVTVTDDDTGAGSDTLTVTVSGIEEPPTADVGVTITDSPDPVSSGSNGSTRCASGTMARTRRPTWSSLTCRAGPRSSQQTRHRARAAAPAAP